VRFGNLESMIGGWFIGAFEPNFYTSQDFEVSIKKYKVGENEAEHYQRTAIEITAIISGRARMGTHYLKDNDLILIEPGESCDFEAITDVLLIAIKCPSIPEDKVVV